MTEREIRLCIAGTVSEAQLILLRVNEHGDPDKIEALIADAEAELMRAREYLAELLKVVS